MPDSFIKTQRPLILLGFGFAALFAVLSILALLDPTEITGQNRWIKPIKFSVSIAIYAWTLAVYLFFLRNNERTVRLISYGTIAIFVGEMVLVILQAARGVRSHFNFATPLDGAIFAAMGLMIFLNTLLIAYVLFLFFGKDVDVSRTMLWAMRLGLIIVIAASAQGAYMSQAFSHSVGVPDGGPGLPFLNWATNGGDLRVAHFVGLHAFQAVPLFALAVEKLGLNRTLALTSVFAVLYFGAFTFVFGQALLGRPLW